MTSRLWTVAMAAVAGMALLAPAVSAQQEPAPAQEPSAETTQQPEATPPAPAGPVGGVEAYRLEGNGLGRSNYVVRLTVQEFYNSNPVYAQTSATAQSDSVSTITGGITLQALQRNSSFSLDYSSEGLIYNNGALPNAAIQQLGVNEKLTLRRWSLFFGENFSYLPSSAFLLGGLGITGGTSAGLPGVGGSTGFNQYLQPTQTVGAVGASQISSASAFQAQYDLGGSAILHASVVAGYLHFLGSGSDLVNTRTIAAQFGYDKGFTRRDTISISYAPTRLDYSAGYQGFTSHQILVGYRRLLTGHLNVSLQGGPNIIHFSTATGQAALPGGTNMLSWSLYGTLAYAMRNGSISAQYSHGTAGGSGFLIGSINDQVNASFVHRFSRSWSAVLNGGFARNSSLEQTTPGTTSSTAYIFNTWFAGVSVTRNLGRYSKLAFNYNATRQTGNTTTCVNALACGPIALTQIIGVTLNWSSRPMKLE